MDDYGTQNNFAFRENKEIKLEYSILERNKVKPRTVNMIVTILWTETENNSRDKKEAEYVKKKCWDIEETSDRKKKKQERYSSLKVT